MAKVCYLCGQEIIESDVNSDDHVVPQQLISRTQPKVKGFDYGGFLPTHEICNNRFGPETYCLKAIKLITVLNNENCVSLHKDKPIMVLNSDCFKEFNQRDLKFFKFIDVRESSVEDISQSSFYTDKQKANPKRDALFTLLAVLTKSVAALLVARHLHEVPPRWKVLAIPYTGTTEAVDFDEFFGNTKPFDLGVKVWVKQTNTGDWFAAYKTQNILVYFLFKFSGTDTFWNGMAERFPDADCFCFESDNLNALIDYQWGKLVKPKTTFTGA